MPVSVPISGPLRAAVLVDRPNRFLIRARVDPEGEVVEAHLPDPGRLREFMNPGTPLWLAPAADPRRRTRFTARLSRTPEGTLVSLDTQLPNGLLAEALSEGLPELDGFEVDRAEVPVGRHRFDFRLLDPFGNGLLLEVKGVNWCRDRVAMFPDAPTDRGTRQVRALTEHVASGGAAAVMFLCQRSDVERVTLAHEVDPDFAQAMAEALTAGVRPLARRCLVTLEEMSLGNRVPFSMAP